MNHELGTPSPGSAEGKQPGREPQVDTIKHVEAQLLAAEESLARLRRDPDLSQHLIVKEQLVESLRLRRDRMIAERNRERPAA